MHERIPMIDEENAFAGARAMGDGCGIDPRWRLAAECVEKRGRFDAGFALLRLWGRIVEERRPCAHFGDSVLEAHGAEGETRVQVSVESEHADGSSVPGARRLFVVFDELH